MKVNDISLYKNELANLETLKEHLNNRKTEESIQMFHKFKSKMSQFESDFNKFVATCPISSQVCQYFENFVNMVKLLKKLISADPSGDWKSHLQAVQNILPIFRVFNRINYLLYRSLYLENMKQLPRNYPEIYEKFLKGLFAVKQSQGNLNAVAGVL